MQIKKPLVLAVFVSALLVGCGGAEDRKAEYMAQAKESFAERDYEKAKLAYKNVIQIDPKDIEPRLGLAEVLSAERDYRAAAAQYIGAMQIDENDRTANLELGKLYLLGRSVEKASEHLDRVLSVNPKDVGGRTLKAGILSQQDKMDEALALLKEVYDEHPTDLDNTILYASLLLRSDRPNDAIKITDKALEVHADSIDLRSILVAIHSDLKNFDQAIGELKNIIEVRPDVFAHKQRLVQYYMSIGQQENAIALLEDVIATAQSESELEDAMISRKALVEFDIKSGNIDQAKAKLEKYIAEFPEEYDFQIGKARLAKAQGEADESIATLDKIIEEDKVGPAAVSAKVEKAKIFLSQEKIEDAKIILETVLVDNPNTVEALMLRGQINFQEKRFDDAINDFRIVLKSDPEDVKVQKALAETHLQAGELRLAENYLKQLNRRLPQDIPVMTALAEVSARMGNIDKAVELREDMVLYQPDGVQNMIELAKLYSARGEIDKLNSTAELLQGTEEGKVSGLLFAGLAAQAKQDHNLAIQRFDEALALSPNAIEPISAKVKSYIASGQDDKAVAWLQSLSEENPNPLALNLLGTVYVLQDKPELGLESFDKAIAASPTWLQPYKHKSFVQRAQNDSDGAITTLKAALKQNETAHTYRVELAQLLVATGDVDGAIEQYETMFELSNKSQVSANNLAMLLVTYREDETSLNRALEVAEVLRGSDNPAFMDTLGWVYLKRNQVDLGLPLIREASRRAPDYAQITYHLAIAYNMSGDKDLAIQNLEKALASGAQFDGKAEAEALLEDLKAETSSAGA